MPLRVARFFLLMVCSAVLSGCGGGGSGGGGGAGGGGSTSAGTITIANKTLTFEAGLDQSTPLPQTITATVTGVSAPQTLYLVITVTGPAVNFISTPTITGSTTGQAVVYPASQLTLGIGTFTSTIKVIACTTDPQCSSTQLNGSPITINVTNKVDGIASSMSSLTYAVGNNPVSANFTASLSVSGNQDWTAQSDTPWLSVTPTSGSAGTTPTVLTATVDASQVDALDSGTYTANIRLIGGNIITVPVTLNVARTQVNYASPYAQVSGATDDVIIRGEHFDLAPPTGVVFGSVAATAFTVVSSTEIHATHPPLTAGTYVVHVPNAQNIDRTRAQLTIYDAQNISAASLDYPGSNPQGVGVSSLFYDAGRAALLVYEVSPITQVLRYTYSSSTGWSATPLAVAFPGAQAFTPSADGSKLFVGFLEGALDLGVYEADPVTLAVLKTTTETMQPVLGEPISMSVANDGLAILTFSQSTAMTYSELRPGFNLLVPSQPTYLIGQLTASSLDGSIVALSSGGPSQAAAGIWQASTEQFIQPTQFGQSGQPSVNRDGTRSAIQTTVYDQNFAVLGNLPTTTVATAFSPTSAKVYTYDTNGFTGTVRTFDTSATPVGGQFPEIGTGVTPPGSYLLPFARMTVSPDGNTLFLAGQAHIAVMPAP